MQKHLVSSFLRDVDKAAKDGKRGKRVNAMQDASTQTEREENTNTKTDKSTSQDELNTDLKISNNSLSDSFNSWELKSPSNLQSSERKSSQLSSSTDSTTTYGSRARSGITEIFTESKEDESDYSEQESSPKSTAVPSAASFATSKNTSPRMSQRGSKIETYSSAESSTRIPFTKSAAESNSFKRPAADFLSYMTRGFKFSYFEYYSR